MTRARNAANGLATPPPLQPWLNAVLLLCVSLVQGVAAMFGMRFNFKRCDWHTADGEEALPQTKPDIQLKETKRPPRLRPVVAQRRTATLAHFTNAAALTEPVLQRTRLSPLVPANAGTQGGLRGLFRLAASHLRTRHNRSWIPAFVGMSGALRIA